MNRVSIFGLVLLGLVVASCATKEPKADVASEISRLERLLGDAQAAQDTATLERLLADDFLGVNAGGMEMTRADVVRQVTSPEFELESLSNEEIRVRLFGETAVVHAVAVVKGRVRGREAGGRFRYTRVWVKRDGRWQAVAGQSTPLANP